MTTHRLAIGFISLTVFYLVQTVICYFNLNEETFSAYFSSQDYAAEMYDLTSTVCLVNIGHAFTLMLLGAVVVLFTRRFKILNESHYI